MSNSQDMCCTRRHCTLCEGTTPNLLYWLVPSAPQHEDNPEKLRIHRIEGVLIHIDGTFAPRASGLISTDLGEEVGGVGK